MPKSLLARPFRVLVLLSTAYKTHREALRGLVRYVRINGPWTLFVVEGRDDEFFDPEADLSSFDGAFVASADRYFGLLKRVRKPTVVVDPWLPDRFERAEIAANPAVCAFVWRYNEAIGRRCAEFFVKRDYFQFGFVQTDKRTLWADGRERGFVECATSRGGRCFVYRPFESRGDSKNSFARWLVELPKPIALSAATDAVGRRTIDVCRSLKFNVPRDVAVLGVDDDRLLCESTTPFLSSVSTNLDETRFQAAELLDRRMRGETFEPQTLWHTPNEIVERGSTTTPPTDDSIVLNALELIRLNLSRGFGVDEIAEKLDVSRRTLETRFRKNLNRSVLDVVRETRLERAKLLLLETDRSVAEVARLCGFRNENYLATVFRRFVGVGPSKFRRAARKTDDESKNL